MIRPARPRRRGTPRRRVALAAAGLTAAALLSACSGAGPRPALPPQRGVVQAVPVPAYPLPSVQRLVRAAAAVQQVPPRVQAALSGAVSDEPYGLLARRGCLPVYSTTSVSPRACVFGDPTGRHTMVVLGDSHAAMWLPALDAIGRRTGWRVIDFNKVSCPPAEVPVYLNQQSRPYRECGTWLRWVLPEVNSLAPDIFMITGETGYRVLGGGSLESGLVRTLDAVTHPGTRKVVLGDIAYLAQDAPDCLEAHPADAQACSTPLYQAVNQAGVRAERAAAEAAGATFIDPVPWLCSSVCTAMVGNMVVYADEQDLTQTYVRFVSGALQAALQPAMQAVSAPGGAPTSGERPGRSTS